MKTCSNCKAEKDPADFTKDRKRPDGLNVYCRACTRAAVRAYAAANPEKARRRSSAWYAANRQRRDALAVAWRAGNPEKSASYSAKWRAANPEKSSEANRKWYAANRDRKLLADKIRRERNLETFLERERASYAKTREKRARLMAIWRASNRPAIAFHAARRRTAVAQRTPPWLLDSDFEQMRAWFWYAAFLTESTGQPHHVDHIVPLRGKNVSGLNVPWNLQALPALDNLKKSNRHDV